MRSLLIRARTVLAVLLVTSAVGAVLWAQAAPVGLSNGSRWNDQAHDTHPFDKPYTFATLSAAGPTEPVLALAHVHGVYVVVAGSPAGCTGRLQASSDLSNWFDLDAADETCTSNVSTFLVDKPAYYVRYNLKTLTGGSSPTVKVAYVGY